jgi:hypothetical protein
MRKIQSRAVTTTSPRTISPMRSSSLIERSRPSLFDDRSSKNPY